MYVKWFDTVMLYYVILVISVNVTSTISCQFHPRTSRRRRERNLEDRCQHWLEDIARDAAGGKSRERRTRYVQKGSRNNAARYSRV
ncbi:unnamed protein product [Staurois parvus]|uniref:Secreted protein n=1 Tax=Staurois parvus TaxID=386267 RepID=A0ABN9DWQ3_9NEOB|nr:unnamed protein product [Staurois parvus]